MRCLLLVLFFLLSAKGVIAYDAKLDLQETAKRVKEKRAIAAYNRELDRRAKVEAERLGVGVDKIPVIRDIIVVWGNDYRIGLALAKSESGLRCEAYHFNSNGTVDHSVFQLNSVHLWRGNLVDCKENVRIAYEIYKEQGPHPWVVWWKGIAKRWL